MTDSDTAVLDAPAAVPAATTEESAVPEAAVVEPAVEKEGETPEQKETRERDEAGRFTKKEIDYSTVILPKDAAIDPAVLEKTIAIARASGFSREQAQAAVDLVNEQVGASRAALLASHQPGGAEWTKQLDAWKAQTMADPSLGNTPDERKASVALGASVLKAYAAAHPSEADGITAFLDTSGLGEHPAVVKLFRWLGESAAEKPLSTPTDHRSAPKSTADVFYPKGATRTEDEVRADP